jgi:hypothetical protein
MNALTRALILSSVLATPAIALAQNTQVPLTRADVRADLVRLEQVGYYPAHPTDNGAYPQDIQAAEAKVQPPTQMPMPMPTPMPMPMSNGQGASQ